MPHKPLKRAFIFLFLLLGILPISKAQNEAIILSSYQFQAHQRIFLAPLEGWYFRSGNDPEWAKPELNLEGWEKMKISEISPELEDGSGRLEGWFRIKIKLDESLKNIPISLSRNLWAATDVYLDGTLVHSFGDTGNPYEAFNPILKYPIPLDLEVGKEYLLAIHFVDYESLFTQREIRLKPENLRDFINLTGPEYGIWVTKQYKLTHIYVTLCIAVSFLLAFLYWFLAYLNPDQKIFRLIGGFTTVVLVGSILIFGNLLFEIPYFWEKVRFILSVTFQAIMTLFALFVLEWVLVGKISKVSWLILSVLLLVNILAHVFSISWPFGIAFTAMFINSGRIIFSHKKEIKGAKWAIILGAIVPTLATLFYLMLHKYNLDLYNEYDKLLLSLTILSPPLFLLAYISMRFKETLDAERAESELVLKISEEKKELLANQNTLLENQVKERTAELSQSLENLKATQTQLIQSEKMASLGELTAGIAHEIQNPLNFVNNFSELSTDLIEEMREELAAGNGQAAEEIAEDLKANLSKINHHGKRADAIVKSMLEHSKTGTGQKELTDINKLISEITQLAYRNHQAKDQSLEVNLNFMLDPGLPQVEVIPSDLGKVILNLVNNALYACGEKATLRQAQGDGSFTPEVIVSTNKTSSGIEISVHDNGIGIPEAIKDKIFQPFFTTKPTGSGTGLGLSLSYDIVKAHGGELLVESKKEQETSFIIILHK